MKTIKLIGWILCLQISMSAFGQAGNWTMPPQVFDNINTNIFSLPTQAGNYGGTPATNCHAGYTDPSGNLMFFTVDEHVYDQDGYLIGEMEHGSFPKKGLAERLILPMGNDCQKYAIIYSAAENDIEKYDRQKRRRIYMAIYNRQDANTFGSGQGDLHDFIGTSGNTLVDISHRDGMLHGAAADPSYPPIYGFDAGGSNHLQYNQQIAATSLIDNCFYYVFIFDGKHLIRYKLTSNDLEYDDYVYELPNPGELDQILRSEMELITLPNGDYRIALPRDGQNSASGTINILDIDDSNGEVISGSLQVINHTNSSNDPIYPIGMEFNSTGEYLYYTHLADASTTDVLEVYEVSSQTILSTPALTGIGNFDRSFIERYGNDLYIASDDKIGKLTNTDAPTVSPFLALDPSLQSITSGYGCEMLHGSFLDYTRYLLPEQLDMSYPNLADMSCSCCADWSAGHGGYTATTSGTWEPGNNPFGSVSGDVYMKEDLIIAPGVDITIKDMTFYFSEDAKVVVRREETDETGAYLYLTDETVFTADLRCNSESIVSCGESDDCDKKRWPGIRVEGFGLLNTQYFNSSTPHGRLKVDDNSMIEYAEIGAKAGHLPISIFSGGGMIRMYKARVKDCITGVRFDPFLRASGSIELYTESYIQATHFSTTSDWFNGDVPFVFVDIESSSGIRLKGNKYENQIPQHFLFLNRGIGVKLANSRVESDYKCTGISLPCPSGDIRRTEYLNLQYGVYGINSGGVTRTYYDYFSEFRDNYIGVYLSNFINPQLMDGDYEVMAEKYATGIYLENSTGYTVQNNELSTYLGYPPNNNIGIHVSNSGDADNEIYRNFFKNLSRGGVTTKINSETGSYYKKGLDWLCNEFEFPILQADLYLSGTMSDEQGDCNGEPAGNLFSTGPFGHYDLYSTTGAYRPIDYNHHAGSLPSNWIPNPVSQVSPPPSMDYIMGPCLATYDSRRTCPIKRSFVPENYDERKSGDSEEAVEVEFESLTFELVSAAVTELTEEIESFSDDEEQSMSNTIQHELNTYWQNVVSYYMADTVGTISKDEMIGLLQEYQPEAVQKFASIICPQDDQSWIHSVNCEYTTAEDGLGLPVSEEGTLPRNLPEYYESDFFQMPGNTNELNQYYIDNGAIYDPIVEETELEDIVLDEGKSNSIEDSNILVSPNPFNETVTFNLSEMNIEDADVKIEFYDLVGRKVYNLNVNEGQTQITIDAYKLPKGLMTFSVFVNGVAKESGKIVRVD